VRINEVMAQNLTTVADEMGEFEPWLELHSREDSPLDLGGHYLTDRLTDLTRWEIPAGTVIPDGGHLLIWLDGETLEGPLHASIDFPSMGGLLILVAPDGQRIVDMVDAPAPSVDVGYGRYPDGSDNFFAMQFPTPGARNILTPGTRLLINEVLASNSMSGVDEMLEADDWIELYNPSDVTIDAAGLYLTDDITNQAKWQIPGAAGSSISPEGHLLIWIDDDENQGTFHASFNLSAAGESISLFDVDGMALIDSVAFGPQTTDASLARLPDGGEFRISAAPTPGASNVLALILQDIVDVILGIRGLTPPERAEADLDASGVIDAADLVGKINP
jgi:hypothetical protein